MVAELTSYLEIPVEYFAAMFSCFSKEKWRHLAVTRRLIYESLLTINLLK